MESVEALSMRTTIGSIYTPWFFAFCLLVLLINSGCALINRDELTSLRFRNHELQNQLLQADSQAKQLNIQCDTLRSDLDRKSSEVSNLLLQFQKQNLQIDRLSQEVLKRRTDQDTLRRAHAEFADKLQQEIEAYQAKLEMTERGLVIVFIAEVLFDSGSAHIRPEAFPMLDKVAKVLNDNLARNKIAVEGHTDNQPIRRSAWESNWELSAARALSVLHYFSEESQVEPMRLSAIAFGEYQPRESNTEEEGRRQNRRVEIVIFPELKKQI